MVSQHISNAACFVAALEERLAGEDENEGCGVVRSYEELVRNYVVSVRVCVCVCVCVCLLCSLISSKS